MAAVTTQNESDRRVLRDGWPRVRRVELIAGSGVDLQHFHALSLPAGPPSGPLVCAQVSRMLTSKGVECLGPPERSPRGHSFFFAKDFDGNLIELMDLGRMYYVLGWLGPLGGWLFRRGMYKQYYADTPKTARSAASRGDEPGS